jgi:hypothetical protein
MCLFGCSSGSGGSASTPPSTGTGSATSAGSNCNNCCPPFVIRSETVATQPTTRTRTRVGIGEEVRLTTDPSTSATWTIVGDNGDMGTLSTASGSSTTYTACDRAKSITVQAVSACGHTTTIAFTVVAIGSGTLESPTDISAIAPPTITVGFTAVPTVQPTDVSFMNCEMREGTCPAAASGVFASQAGNVHADTGSWVPFSASVDAHGTALGTRDTVSTTAAISTFPAAGTTDGRFHWPIPWRAQVRGGGVNGAFVFGTPLDHVKAYTAATRLLDVSKGGQRANRTVP